MTAGMGGWTRVVALVGGLALAGCNGSESEPADGFEVPAGCNPIAAEHDCLLPFPSDVFLVEAGELPSGHRVELPEQGLPHTTFGAAADLTQPYPADGFSVGSPILVLLSGGVDDVNLVTAARDPAESLALDSPTQLIDVETGEAVLHLAELDPRADDDARRALIIRPLVRLEHEHRYLVALRGIRDRAGGPVPAPEGFARLRDGRVPAGSVLEPLAPRYEAEIFPVLAAAGLPRAELQLAWDFTTESEQNVTADMLAVRSDVIAKLAAAEPEVEVVSVTDDASAAVWRRIDAVVRVPMYLESTDPLARLLRDGAGRPAPQGTVDVPFVVAIPRSVGEAAPGTPPARLVQFGHGFFGTREEVMTTASYFGEPLGVVLVATEFWGMRDADRTPVGNRMVTDPSTTMELTDGVHQAIANFIALELAARGPLAALPEMQRDGSPLYDTSQIYFYGISGGGILGGTVLALSPTIERGALSVGAANYSFIAFRSRSFGPFLLILQGVLPDPLDQQKFVALWQTGFDRIDPLTYAPHVLADPYADSPAERRVLMQVGLGDAAVTSFAAHLHARALGAAHLQPAPRPICGLASTNGPHDGSAIVEFDFGVEPLPDLQPIVGPETPVHDGVRRLDAANAQLDGFLEPGGVIVHTCDGVCDPE